MQSMRALAGIAILIVSSAAALAAENIRCFFSPNGGCTQAIINEIAAAEHTIQIQCYVFTSERLKSAIERAHRRGVAITVIADARGSKCNGSVIADLADAGIKILIDRKHAIAHNKIFILDNETVISGSFNFTKQAENRNAENLIIICDTATTVAYKQNWWKHSKHADPYFAKAAAAAAAAVQPQCGVTSRRRSSKCSTK